MVRYLASNVASRNQQSFLKSVHKWIYYSDFKKIDFSQNRGRRSEIDWVRSKDPFFDHNSRIWEDGSIKLINKIAHGKAVTATYHTSTALLNFIRVESSKNPQNAEFQYFLGMD